MDKANHSLDTSIRRPVVTGRWRHALVAAVLLGSLAATFWGWLNARQQAEERVRREFLGETRRIADALTDRFNSFTDALRGGVALFAASERVSREEWQAYVARLGVLERHTGLQGMGYSLRIPAEALAAHEAEVRTEGFPDYVVRPVEPREEYHSIVYLEPFSGRNLRAFGYDMFSEPTRREAMERSRDRGEPALSGKVVLVQETDERPQAGCLLYVPVYGNGAPIGSEAERRSALRGFVYSPFRMDDLMAMVLSGDRPAVAVRVYDDGQRESSALMHDGWPVGRAMEAAPYDEWTVLEVAGRRWTLRFTAMPEFLPTAGEDFSWLVLSCGLALTAALGSLLITTMRHAAQVEALVSRRTAELKHANAQLLQENAERRMAEIQRQETLESLAAKNAELERFNQLAVGRELRMIELKREVNGLSRAGGRNERYDLSFVEDGSREGEGA